jgi:hypothetical protein
VHLLQGIYAFFAISAFWRTQRSEVGGSYGDFEYAYARCQTQEALDIALRNGNLTERGRRFAEGLAGEMLTWSHDAIDAQADALARLVADGHRAGWRIRHCRPAAQDVAALVEVWDGDRPADVAIGASEVLPDPEMRHWSAARLGLARRRLVTPDRYEQARDENWGATLTDADLALFAGDPQKAAAAFVDEIGRNPESVDAWTGLGLALRADIASYAAASAALLNRPEIVLAVYRESRTHSSPVSIAEFVGDQLR